MKTCPLCQTTWHPDSDTCPACGFSDLTTGEDLGYRPAPPAPARSEGTPHYEYKFTVEIGSPKEVKWACDCSECHSARLFLLKSIIEAQVCNYLHGMDPLAVFPYKHTVTVQGVQLG